MTAALELLPVAERRIVRGPRRYLPGIDRGPLRALRDKLRAELVMRAAQQVGPGYARTLRIAELLGVHLRTAERYIRSARALGFVVECKRGRPQRQDYSRSRRGERASRKERNPWEWRQNKADTNLSGQNGSAKGPHTPYPPKGGRSSLLTSSLSSILQAPSLHPELVAELGWTEEQVVMALRAIAHGFPECESLASAVDACRRVASQGLKGKNAADYFRSAGAGAPPFGGIEKAGTPWLAAASRMRFEKWLGLQRSRDEGKRKEKARNEASQMRPLSHYEEAAALVMRTRHPNPARARGR